VLKYRLETIRSDSHYCFTQEDAKRGVVLLMKVISEDRVGGEGSSLVAVNGW
jgi:hypothetical protein